MYHTRSNNMERYIKDKNTGIVYELIGDFYYPCSLVSPSNFNLGRYGRLKERYLKTYNKPLYYSLLLSGEPYSYLKEIDCSSIKMKENIINAMAKDLGITEQLKANDMMQLVRKMNNISNIADEIVLNEIIYSI